MPAETLTIVGGSGVADPAPPPGTPAVFERLYGSLRATPRPYDHLLGGQYGFYRVGVQSGLTTGIAAGGLLFSFRWGAPGAVALILRVTVQAAINTTFTSSQPVDADIVHVRGWTASDSGGTAISVLGSGNKQRGGNMGPSLISQGDLRVASASAITAGGTKTADANAFGSSGLTPNAGQGVSGAPTDLYKLDNNGSHPPVYAQNEGFNIRLVKAQGAAGVVAYYFTVEWAELSGF